MFIIARFMCTVSSAVLKKNSNLKKYLYPGISLNFQIHIGIHLKKTGQKLIYEYWYYEKHQSTWMSVLPFFNGTFFLLLKTPYLLI